MKKILMAAILIGAASGAYAANIGPGALEVYRDGPLGGMPSGRYSPEFADLAVHASDLGAQGAAQTAAPEPVPAPGEDAETLRLRAAAAADPGKFIDEHTPEEVGIAFGLYPTRSQVTNSARIQNAVVQLTVDLTRQRLKVKSPALNAEFRISSGLLPDNGTPGSGKCFAPDVVEAMHFSTLYNNAPMPNTVFFNGNVALHGTSFMNELKLGWPVSHGCVRLSRVNSKKVYDLVLKTGKSKVIICVTGTTPE